MPFCSICPPQLAFTESVTAQLPDPPPPTSHRSASPSHSPDGGTNWGRWGVSTQLIRPARSPVPLLPDSQRRTRMSCALRESALGSQASSALPAPRGTDPAKILLSHPASLCPRLTYLSGKGSVISPLEAARQTQPPAHVSQSPAPAHRERPSSPVKTDPCLSLLFSPLLPGWRGRGRGGGWGTDGRDLDGELS